MWAYPVGYRPALACSILSMSLPLSLPYGWPVLERPGRVAAFPCSVFTTGWVRSTLYTGGASFASGHVRRPDPDRWPLFGRSLKQPRMARSFDDACECSHLLTLPSDSSAAPGLGLPGWLRCRGGFGPRAVARAARQTPAPLEYLPRKAGLGRENLAQQWCIRLHVTTNDQLTHSRPTKASAANRASESLVAWATEEAGGCWVQRLVGHVAS